MTAKRILIADLISKVSPGSQGDEWTWSQEARWCWDNEFDVMVKLVSSLLDEGQREPVMVGDDGRLWDGHHRLVGLIAIGETYVDAEVYNELDSATQMDRLLASIEDLEARESR